MSEGDSCLWNSQCTNKACGRPHNTDSKECCATGKTSAFWGWDWCAGYQPGEVCRHDGQCLSGTCTNNACACTSSSETFCGPAVGCVNLSADDPQNCGACGAACTWGTKTCSNGSCCKCVSDTNGFCMYGGGKSGSCACFYPYEGEDCSVSSPSITKYTWSQDAESSTTGACAPSTYYKKPDNTWLPSLPDPAITSPATFDTLQECVDRAEFNYAFTEDGCVPQALGAYGTEDECMDDTSSFNIAYLNGIKQCVRVQKGEGNYDRRWDCQYALNPGGKLHTTDDSQCKWVGGLFAFDSGPYCYTSDAKLDASTCALVDNSFFFGSCFSTTAQQCRGEDECAYSLLHAGCHNTNGGGSHYCELKLSGCECFNRDYVAQVWPSTLTVSKQMVFPEQCPRTSPPTTTGVAMAGPAGLGFAAAMGIVRALQTLPASAYMSTGFGASLFYGPYLFGSAKHNPIALLGASTPPAHITLRNLFTDNNALTYMGNLLAFSHVNWTIVTQKLFHAGAPSDAIWSYALNEGLLKPLGMDGASPVARDHYDAYRIRADNPTLGPPLVPPAGMPFWVANAAVFTPVPQFPAFNLTPMYSGMLGLHAYNSADYRTMGGTWQETFATGSRLPVDPVTDPVPVTALTLCDTPARLHVQSTRNKMVTLSDIMAASSASSWFTSIAQPTYAVWPAPPGSRGVGTSDVQLGDAGCAENMALLSLMARRLDRIVCFLQPPQDLDVAESETLRAMFGLSTTPQTMLPAPGDLQIFATDSYPTLLQNLKDSRAGGGPCSSVFRADNVQNALYGVNDKFLRTVLFIVLQRAPKFEQQLPANVIKEFGATGLFPGFPYMPASMPAATGSTGNLISLTRPQVNLLASFTDWYTTQLSSEIQLLYDPKKLP